MLFPSFKPNHLTDWTLQLPKIGKIEVILHRPIPEGFVPKQVRVVKKAMGWFAVIRICSDVSIPEPAPQSCHDRLLRLENVPEIHRFYRPVG